MTGNRPTASQSGLFQAKDGETYTLESAKKRAASIAFADLIGTSGDGYPFAAVKFRKSLPAEWQDEVEDVVVFVYHNERKPEGL